MVENILVKKAFTMMEIGFISYGVMLENIQILRSLKQVVTLLTELAEYMTKVKVVVLLIS